MGQRWGTTKVKICFHGGKVAVHGLAAIILEGLAEMLTLNRLGLPVKLRRSLACTNSIENMMGTCAASG
jgi:hypothetical protein